MLTSEAHRKPRVIPPTGVLTPRQPRYSLFSSFPRCFAQQPVRDTDKSQCAVTVSSFFRMLDRVFADSALVVKLEYKKPTEFGIVFVSSSNCF